jgi:hypothetical protein
MGSQAGSTLRASLSASGSMVLYNLELDLQSLLSGWPFSVQRAFAHRLTVTVRWASLTIQVHSWPCWRALSLHCMQPTDAMFGRVQSCCDFVRARHVV